MDRRYRRIRPLQRKPKAAPGIDPWTIPDKPPGIHWQTYGRLVVELRVAIARQDAHVGALMARPEHADL